MSVYLSHGLGHVINAAFGNTADKEKPDSLKPFLDMPNQVPFKTHYEHTKLNDFVHETFVEGLRSAVVVLGKDSRFGLHNSGDIDTMRD